MSTDTILGVLAFAILCVIAAIPLIVFALVTRR